MQMVLCCLKPISWLINECLYVLMLCSFTDLECLELRENLLKYLPSSLSFLVKLKTLDLGSNILDELVSKSACQRKATLKVSFLGKDVYLKY